MKETAPSMRKVDVARTIKGYDAWIVRAYCWGRFKIMRQPFLDEIGQYLPASGRVLDVGCGFGLFSLHYAQMYPDLDLVGVDINRSRIETARRTAARLSIPNVRYEVGDAASLSVDGTLDGAYMLDVIHHIPPQAVVPLLREIHERLAPESTLIIKDVDTSPAYKRWFTFVLDKLLDLRAPVHYWPRTELLGALREVGFEPRYHSMPDYLPYPHMLYVCAKRSRREPRATG